MVKTFVRSVAIALLVSRIPALAGMELIFGWSTVSDDWAVEIKGTCGHVEVAPALAYLNGGDKLCQACFKEFMKSEITPIHCKLAYEWAIAQYYPQAPPRQYKVDRFKVLAMLLQQSGLRADKYILSAFSFHDGRRKYGTVNEARYPTIKQLADPEMFSTIRSLIG